MSKKIITVLCVLFIAVSMCTPAYAAKKDTKAPLVMKTDPKEKATDIMIENRIVVRFSEKIKKGKALKQITLKGTGQKAITCTYEFKDNLLFITPDQKLSYSREYTLTIPAAAVKDAAGNTMKEEFALGFITEEDPAQEVEEASDMNYRLEVEASLPGEYTAKEVQQYLVQYLKMFGIDAKIKKVEKITE